MSEDKRTRGEIAAAMAAADPEAIRTKMQFSNVIPLLEFEQTVIGGLLIDPECAASIENLTEDDFTTPSNRMIFRAMASLRKRKEPIDLITVTSALQTIKALEKAGGVTYLSELANAVPTTANFDYYFDKLKVAGVKRRISSVLDNGIFSSPDELKELIDRYFVTNIKQKSSFDILDMDEQDALPDPEWLVDDIAYAKSLAFVYGASQSLKSFLTLDMSLSIAYGIPWHGKKVKQSGVIYIAAEGANGIKRRRHAWRIHKGIPKEQKAPFYLIKKSVETNNPSVIAELTESIRAKLGQDPNIGLIVVDTFNRCFRGEENSASDVGKFTAACEELQNKLGVTVLVVHHTGKDEAKGMRGSGSLYDNADTVLSVKRNGDRHIEVTLTKQKDGETDTKTFFSYQKIDTEYGDSLVLDAIAGDLTIEDNEEEIAPKIPIEKIIVETLKDHPDGLTMAEIMKMHGLNNRAYDARNYLLDVGRIVQRGKRLCYQPDLMDTRQK